MYTNLYLKITDALVNDGYIVIQNALDPQLIQKLYLQSLHEANFKLAGISQNTANHLDTTKRSDKTLWIEKESPQEEAYLAFAQGLETYLNRSLYLGLSYYEAHFAIYNQGDFYEKHLDAFQGSKNRIVTTVLYLNEAWKEDDGGELIIYDKDDTVIAKVMPEANTLVVFLSEDFPHEVLQAKRKRHSIAGWFRVDKKFV